MFHLAVFFLTYGSLIYFVNPGSSQELAFELGERLTEMAEHIVFDSASKGK